MSLAVRGTRAAARSLRQAHIVRPARRYASDSHGQDHAHGHGHGESALHLKHANPSGSEGLGMGMWMTLACVPLFYVGYSLAYGSEDNVFARLYLKYKSGQEDTAQTEELHKRVLSQAILDRARLSSFPRETSGPDLRYPEFFNAGSPWNQAVGEGAPNMKKLEEYYKQVQAEANQERLAKMKDGKPVSIYD